MLHPTRTRERQRVSAGALLALLTTLTLALPVPPAAAHNNLRSSSPADGDELGAPPGEISLLFDDDVVDLGTRIAVTGPGGAVEVGAPQVSGSTVTAALPPDLAAGTYTVAWRVTSADGHPISGELSFATAAPQSGATATTTSPASSPSPTATGTVGDDAAGERATAEDAGAGDGLPSGFWAGVAVLAVAAIGGAVALRRGRSHGAP